MLDIDLNILLRYPVFANLDRNGIQHVLSCLEASIKEYNRGDIIYAQFDDIEYGGIILNGYAKSSTFNANGDEHNIRIFEPGDLFGESFACIPASKIVLQISSLTDCKILFLKLSNLLKDYATTCPYASRVTINILKIIAANNIFQLQKTEIINQKKIRDKLILFLKTCKFKNNQIILPFNRQELANYLGVERSALSRELSKMQQEGIISYHKNKFTLMHKL